MNPLFHTCTSYYVYKPLKWREQWHKRMQKQHYLGFRSTRRPDKKWKCFKILDGAKKERDEKNNNLQYLSSKCCTTDGLREKGIFKKLDKIWCLLSTKGKVSMLLFIFLAILTEKILIKLFLKGGFKLLLFAPRCQRREIVKLKWCYISFV